MGTNNVYQALKEPACYHKHFVAIHNLMLTFRRLSIDFPEIGYNGNGYITYDNNKTNWNYLYSK